MFNTSIIRIKEYFKNNYLKIFTGLSIAIYMLYRVYDIKKYMFCDVNF
jgi:hypothetical protein